MVRLGNEPLFCPSTTRFWTPHSNRTFVPSATAFLGVEKSVRDFLGGWSAQASEPHAKIAAQRIRNMQRTVVAQLHKGLSDPLAEAETLAQLDEFFSVQGVPEEERSRCGKLLERGVRTEVPRAPEELIRQEEGPDVPEAPTLDEAPAQVGPEHKGRQGEAFVYDVHRMSVLGKSPQKKSGPGLELRSNQASTVAASAKRRSGPCTSSASAASFRSSTTWTTLSRATPCPRELSMTEFVGSAHVMVCVTGEDSSATASSSSSSEGSA